MSRHVVSVVGHMGGNMRQTPGIIWCATIMVLAACTTDKTDIVSIGEPDALTCQDVTGDAVRRLYLDEADLAACYITPELLGVACVDDDDSTTCLVELGPYGVPAGNYVNGCTCLDATLYYCPPVECCVAVPSWDSNMGPTFDSELQAILDDIENRCGAGSVAYTIEDEAQGEIDGSWDLEGGEECENSPGWVMDDPSCATGSAMLGPGAELSLDISSQYSYILVNSGTDSMLSPLIGGGGGATGPAQFISGLAWAQNRELDDVWYEDFRFWFDEPISLNPTNGQYQFAGLGPGVIIGEGLENNDAYRYEFDMVNSASGTLDPVAGWWTLHYSESNGASSVTIHLEGSATPL